LLTGSSSLLPFHDAESRPGVVVQPDGSNLGTAAMPGIHFAQVRATISLADVLNLIGFVPCKVSGGQVRGPCPVHRSSSPSSRSFSANIDLHIYMCFRCGSSGNQLDLYASVTGLSLHAAVIALCNQLQLEIPWVHQARPSLTRHGRAGP
jgi:DNA primase